MGARKAQERAAQHTVDTESRQPTLAAVVREQESITWSRARALCASGQVTVNGKRCLDPALRVRSGEVVVVDQSAPKLRTRPLAETAIVYFDRDVVVVDKPVGMLSVADEPGNRDTLAEYTRAMLRSLGGPGVDAKLGVVHRLDKDTSGLMVFARTAHAKRALAEQFRAHNVERVYRAIAHGTVTAKRIDTYLVMDRGDGLRGSYGRYRRATGEAPAGARRAVTHVTPIAPLAGATLVECRLETGRQHQIRIHLSELGHPLVGERVYIRDYPGVTIQATRTMLHARTLGFVHPRTLKHIRFQVEPPLDFQVMAASLRLAPE